jgi:hypothetical protein
MISEPSRARIGERPAVDDPQSRQIGVGPQLHRPLKSTARGSRLAPTNGRVESGTRRPGAPLAHFRFRLEATASSVKREVSQCARRDSPGRLQGSLSHPWEKSTLLASWGRCCTSSGASRGVVAETLAGTRMRALPRRSRDTGVGLPRRHTPQRVRRGSVRVTPRVTGIVPLLRQ